MKSQPKAIYLISSAELPPLGTCWAAANHTGLVAFEFGISGDDFLKRHFPEELSASAYPTPATSSHPLPALALLQMKEYLAGERQQFSVPIDWRLFTPFQADVYRAVIAIPFGSTCTYSQIAAQIHRPGAPRAVGAVARSLPGRYTWCPFPLELPGGGPWPVPFAARSSRRPRPSSMAMRVVSASTRTRRSSGDPGIDSQSYDRTLD